MRKTFGIILLEHTTIVLRIYETDMKEWKLTHYKSATLASGDNARMIQGLNDLMIDSSEPKVTAWKIGARDLPFEKLQVIASAISLPIESLTQLREHELISKGMFTELW